jgi:hypothetical protein
MADFQTSPRVTGPAWAFDASHELPLGGVPMPVEQDGLLLIGDDPSALDAPRQAALLDDMVVDTAHNWREFATGTIPGVWHGAIGTLEEAHRQADDTAQLLFYGAKQWLRSSDENEPHDLPVFQSALVQGIERGVPSIFQEGRAAGNMELLARVVPGPNLVFMADAAREAMDRGDAYALGRMVGELAAPLVLGGVEVQATLSRPAFPRPRVLPAPKHMEIAFESHVQGLLQKKSPMVVTELERAAHTGEGTPTARTAGTPTSPPSKARPPLHDSMEWHIRRHLVGMSENQLKWTVEFFEPVKTKFDQLPMDAPDIYLFLKKIESSPELERQVPGETYHPATFGHTHTKSGPAWSGGAGETYTGARPVTADPVVLTVADANNRLWSLRSVKETLQAVRDGWGKETNQALEAIERSSRRLPNLQDQVRHTSLNGSVEFQAVIDDAQHALESLKAQVAAIRAAAAEAVPLLDRHEQLLDGVLADAGKPPVEGMPTSPRGASMKTLKTEELRVLLAETQQAEARLLSWTEQGNAAAKQAVARLKLLQDGLAIFNPGIKVFCVDLLGATSMVKDLASVRNWYWTNLSSSPLYQQVIGEILVENMQVLKTELAARGEP